MVSSAFTVLGVPVNVTWLQRSLTEVFELKTSVTCVARVAPRS